MASLPPVSRLSLQATSNKRARTVTSSPVVSAPQLRPPGADDRRDHPAARRGLLHSPGRVADQHSKTEDRPLLECRPLTTSAGTSKRSTPRRRGAPLAYRRPGSFPSPSAEMPPTATMERRRTSVLEDIRPRPSRMAHRGISAEGVFRLALTAPLTRELRGNSVRSVRNLSGTASDLGFPRGR